MPQPPVNDSECERFEERLMAYLENELEPAVRNGMERHRAECAHCDDMVRELEALVRQATNLPPMASTHDLWPGIASRIEAPVVPLRRHAATRSMSLRRFAIAATLLVAVSSAVTWRLARPRTDAAPVVASRGDSGTEAGTILPVVNADVTYEREIAALRTIVSERFAELDSTTVAELQRNLAIIDRAIADSRKALETDPNSRVLSGTLDRALETKLSLMRRVALL